MSSPKEISFSGRANAGSPTARIEASRQNVVNLGIFERVEAETRPAEEGVYPAVLVCHENRGMNAHIQDVARRFAKEGYVALAIDLPGGIFTALLTESPGIDLDAGLVDAELVTVGAPTDRDEHLVGLQSELLVLVAIARDNNGGGPRLKSLGFVLEVELDLDLLEAR